MTAHLLHSILSFPSNLCIRPILPESGIDLVEPLRELVGEEEEERIRFVVGEEASDPLILPAINQFFIQPKVISRGMACCQPLCATPGISWVE